MEIEVPIKLPPDPFAGYVTLNSLILFLRDKNGLNEIKDKNSDWLNYYATDFPGTYTAIISKILNRLLSIYTDAKKANRVIEPKDETLLNEMEAYINENNDEFINGVPYKIFTIVETYQNATKQLNAIQFNEFITYDEIVFKIKSIQAPFDDPKFQNEVSNYSSSQSIQDVSGQYIYERDSLIDKLEKYKEMNNKTIVDDSFIQELIQRAVFIEQLHNDYKDINTTNDKNIVEKYNNIIKIIQDSLSFINQNKPKFSGDQGVISNIEVIESQIIKIQTLISNENPKDLLSIDNHNKLVDEFRDNLSKLIPYDLNAFKSQYEKINKGYNELGLLNAKINESKTLTTNLIKIQLNNEDADILNAYSNLANKNPISNDYQRILDKIKIFLSFLDIINPFDEEERKRFKYIEAEEGITQNMDTVKKQETFKSQLESYNKELVEFKNKLVAVNIDYAYYEYYTAEYKILVENTIEFLQKYKDMGEEALAKINVNLLELESALNDFQNRYDVYKKEEEEKKKKKKTVFVQRDSLYFLLYLQKLIYIVTNKLPDYEDEMKGLYNEIANKMLTPNITKELNNLFSKYHSEHIALLIIYNNKSAPLSFSGPMDYIINAMFNGVKANDEKLNDYLNTLDLNEPTTGNKVFINFYQTIQDKLNEPINYIGLIQPPDTDIIIKKSINKDEALLKKIEEDKNKMIIENQKAIVNNNKEKEEIDQLIIVNQQIEKDKIEENRKLITNPIIPIEKTGDIINTNKITIENTNKNLKELQKKKDVVIEKGTSIKESAKSKVNQMNQAINITTENIKNNKRILEEIQETTPPQKQQKLVSVTTTPKNVDIGDLLPRIKDFDIFSSSDKDDINDINDFLNKNEFTFNIEIQNNISIFKRQIRDFYHIYNIIGYYYKFISSYNNLMESNSENYSLDVVNIKSKTDNENDRNNRLVKDLIHKYKELISNRRTERLKDFYENTNIMVTLDEIRINLILPVYTNFIKYQKRLVIEIDNLHASDFTLETTSFKEQLDTYDRISVWCKLNDEVRTWSKKYENDTKERLSDIKKEAEDLIKTIKLLKTQKSIQKEPYLRSVDSDRYQELITYEQYYKLHIQISLKVKEYEQVIKRIAPVKDLFNVLKVEAEGKFIIEFNDCLKKYCEYFITVKEGLLIQPITTPIKELDSFIKNIWDNEFGRIFNVMNNIISKVIEGSLTIKNFNDINKLFPHTYFDIMRELYTDRVKFKLYLFAAIQIDMYLTKKNKNLLIKRLKYKSIVFDNKNLIINLFTKMNLLTDRLKQSFTEPSIYASKLNGLSDQKDIGDFFNDLLHNSISEGDITTKLTEWVKAYNTIDDYNELESVVLQYLRSRFKESKIEYTLINNILDIKEEIDKFIEIGKLIFDDEEKTKRVIDTITRIRIYAKEFMDKDVVIKDILKLRNVDDILKYTKQYYQKNKEYSSLEDIILNVIRPITDNILSQYYIGEQSIVSSPDNEYKKYIIFLYNSTDVVKILIIRIVRRYAISNIKSIIKSTNEILKSMGNLANKKKKLDPFFNEKSENVYFRVDTLKDMIKSSINDDLIKSAKEYLDKMTALKEDSDIKQEKLLSIYNKFMDHYKENMTPFDLTDLPNLQYKNDIQPLLNKTSEFINQNYAIIMNQPKDLSTKVSEMKKFTDFNFDETNFNNIKDNINELQSTTNFDDKNDNDEVNIKESIIQIKKDVKETESKIKAFKNRNDKIGKLRFKIEQGVAKIDEFTKANKDAKIVYDTLYKLEGTRNEYNIEVQNQTNDLNNINSSVLRLGKDHLYILISIKKYYIKRSKRIIVDIKGYKKKIDDYKEKVLTTESELSLKLNNNKDKKIWGDLLLTENTKKSKCFIESKALNDINSDLTNKIAEITIQINLLEAIKEEEEPKDIQKIRETINKYKDYEDENLKALIDKKQKEKEIDKLIEEGERRPIILIEIVEWLKSIVFIHGFDTIEGFEKIIDTIVLTKYDNLYLVKDLYTSSRKLLDTIKKTIEEVRGKINELYALGRSLDTKKTTYISQFNNLCGMDFKTLDSLKKPTDSFIGDIKRFNESVLNVSDNIKNNIISKITSLETTTVDQENLLFSQQLNSRINKLREYKTFIDSINLIDTSSSYISQRRKNLSEKLDDIIPNTSKTSIKSSSVKGSQGVEVSGGIIYTYNDIPLYIKLSDKQIDKEFDDIKKYYDKVTKTPAGEKAIIDDSKQGSALYKDISALETAINLITETKPYNNLPKTTSIEKTDEKITEYTTFFDFFMKKETKHTLSLKNLKSKMDDASKKLIQIKIENKRLIEYKDKIDRYYGDIRIQLMTGTTGKITEEVVKSYENKKQLETLVRKANNKIELYNDSYIKMTTYDKDLYDLLLKIDSDYIKIDKNIKSDTIEKQKKYNDDLNQTNEQLKKNIEILENELKKVGGNEEGEKKGGAEEITKKESGSTPPVSTSINLTLDYNYQKCLQELIELKKMLDSSNKLLNNLKEVSTENTMDYFTAIETLLNEFSKTNISKDLITSLLTEGKQRISIIKQVNGWYKQVSIMNNFDIPYYYGSITDIKRTFSSYRKINDLILLKEKDILPKSVFYYKDIEYDLHKIEKLIRDIESDQIRINDKITDFTLQFYEICDMKIDKLTKLKSPSISLLNDIKKFLNDTKELIGLNTLILSNLTELKNESEKEGISFFKIFQQKRAFFQSLENDIRSVGLSIEGQPVYGSIFYQLVDLIKQLTKVIELTDDLPVVPDKGNLIDVLLERIIEIVKNNDDFNKIYKRILIDKRSLDKELESIKKTPETKEATRKKFIQDSRTIVDNFLAAPPMDDYTFNYNTKQFVEIEKLINSAESYIDYLKSRPLFKNMIPTYYALVNDTIKEIKKKREELTNNFKILNDTLEDIKAFKDQLSVYSGTSVIPGQTLLIDVKEGYKDYKGILDKVRNAISKWSYHYNKHRLLIGEYDQLAKQLYERLLQSFETIVKEVAIMNKVYVDDWTLFEKFVKSFNNDSNQKKQVLITKDTTATLKLSVYTDMKLDFECFPEYLKLFEIRNKYGDVLNIPQVLLPPLSQYTLDQWVIYLQKQYDFFEQYKDVHGYRDVYLDLESKFNKRLELIASFQNWFESIKSYTDITNKRGIIQSYINNDIGQRQRRFDDFNELLYINEPTQQKLISQTILNIKKFNNQIEETNTFLIKVLNQINGVESDIVAYMIQFKNICKYDLKVLSRLRSPPQTLLNNIRDLDINMNQANNDIKFLSKSELVYKESWDNDKKSIQKKIDNITKEMESNKEYLDIINKDIQQELTSLDNPTRDLFNSRIRNLIDHIDLFLAWKGLTKPDLLQSNDSEKTKYSIRLLRYITDYNTPVFKKDIKTIRTEYEQIKKKYKETLTQATYLKELSKINNFDDIEGLIDQRMKKIKDSLIIVDTFEELKSLTSKSIDYYQFTIKKIGFVDDYLTGEEKRLNKFKSVLLNLKNTKELLKVNATKDKKIINDILFIKDEYEHFKKDTTNNDKYDSNIDEKINELLKQFNNDSTSFLTLINDTRNHLRTLNVLPVITIKINELVFYNINGDTNNISEFLKQDRKTVIIPTIIRLLILYSKEDLKEKYSTDFVTISNIDYALWYNIINVRLKEVGDKLKDMSPLNRLNSKPSKLTFYNSTVKSISLFESFIADEQKRLHKLHAVLKKLEYEKISGNIDKNARNDIILFETDSIYFAKPKTTNPFSSQIDTYLQMITTEYNDLIEQFHNETRLFLTSVNDIVYKLTEDEKKIVGNTPDDIKRKADLNRKIDQYTFYKGAPNNPFDINNNIETVLKLTPKEIMDKIGPLLLVYNDEDKKELKEKKEDKKAIKEQSYLKLIPEDGDKWLITIDNLLIFTRNTDFIKDFNVLKSIPKRLRFYESTLIKIKEYEKFIKDSETRLNDLKSLVQKLKIEKSSGNIDSKVLGDVALLATEKAYFDGDNKSVYIGELNTKYKELVDQYKRDSKVFLQAINDYRTQIKEIKDNMDPSQTTVELDRILKKLDFDKTSNNDIDTFLTLPEAKTIPIIMDLLNSYKEDFITKMTKKYKSKQEYLAETAPEAIKLIEDNISIAKKIQDDILDILKKVEYIHGYDTIDIIDKDILTNIQTIKAIKNLTNYNSPNKRMSFDALRNNMTRILTELNIILDSYQYKKGIEFKRKINLPDQQKLMNEILNIKTAFNDDFTTELKDIINELWDFMNKISSSSSTTKGPLQLYTSTDRPFNNIDYTQFNLIYYPIDVEYSFIPSYIVYNITNDQGKMVFTKYITISFSYKGFIKRSNMKRGGLDLNDLTPISKNVIKGFDEFVIMILQNYYSNTKPEEFNTKVLVDEIINQYLTQKAQPTYGKLSLIKYDKTKTHITDLNDLLSGKDKLNSINIKYHNARTTIIISKKKQLCKFQTLFEKRLKIEKNETLEFIIYHIIVYWSLQSRPINISLFSEYGLHTLTLIEFLLNVSSYFDVTITTRINNESRDAYSIDVLSNRKNPMFNVIFRAEVDRDVILGVHNLIPNRTIIEEVINNKEIYSFPANSLQYIAYKLDVDFNDDGIRYILEYGPHTEMTYRHGSINFEKKFIVDKNDILWMNIDGVFQPKSFIYDFTENISIPVLKLDDVKYSCYIRI